MIDLVTAALSGGGVWPTQAEIERYNAAQSQWGMRAEIERLRATLAQFQARKDVGAL